MAVCLRARVPCRCGRRAGQARWRAGRGTRPPAVPDAVERAADEGRGELPGEAAREVVDVELDGRHTRGRSGGGGRRAAGGGAGGQAA